MNNVALLGRLTADPELRTTQSGLSVTTFTIAVNRPYSKERQADFIDVVAWRNTAEFVCKYFSKGQMVGVVGSIQTRTYTDKNGNNRKAVEVLASNVFFGGGGKKDSDNTAEVLAMASESDYLEIDYDDEDLPF
jgi:single-strand DNA-binding protein